jgi:predicted nucleic acid-binding protein
VSLVIDASATVVLLADAGPAGQWVEASIRGQRLLAPDLMPYEVTNVLRRHALSGRLDPTAAALAYADLLDLPVELYPYELLADRVWALRDNLSAYDASYVALAELQSAALVTLDVRLAHAPGPTCSILLYPPV